MKKTLYFIVFSYINILVFLYNKAVYAQRYFATASTKYGLQSPMFSIRSMFTASIIILFLIWVPLAVFTLIRFLIRLSNRNKNKFDYKSEYQKFKPNAKVKIAFTDKNGKMVTKRCRIVSINDKEISFQDGNSLYECKSTDIKRIQKRKKTLFFIVSCALVFILVVNKIANSINGYVSNVSKYGVPEEFNYYGPEE